MWRYWLGLGGNVGDRVAALRETVAWLRDNAFVVEAVSRGYETAARDLEDQPDFLNAACRVHTGAMPPAMLAAAKRLEADLGREVGLRFGPRRIDCDLLLWSGGAWTGEGLEIPHPRLHERLFALVPLLDLDPELTLPDGRTVAALAAAIDAREQRVRPVSATISLE